MDFAVDHLLHAVNDPYDVRRTFEDRFSWRGTAGGEHPDWGTFNELAYFDLSYIEWIGIKNFVFAAQSRFGREVLRILSTHEGIGQFALRTHDMNAVAAEWAEKGLPFWGPVEGSRVRADGTVVRWRLLFPGQGDPSEYALPFLIDWGVSDEERRASLQNDGVVIEQENNLRLAAIHSIVRDLDNLQSRWEPYFGILNPVGESIDGTPKSLEGDIGGVRIVFWQADSEELRAELEKYGERPIQVDFAMQSKLAEPGTLTKRGGFNPELEVLHGLRIRVI